MKKWIFLLLLLGVVILMLKVCYSFRGSEGGGQTDAPALRAINPANIALPDGYRIEAVATGLTFPSGIAFDADDRAYVIEAGYCYGDVWLTPKLLRIEGGGITTPVANGGKNGPWTGVDFLDSLFYVVEGGHAEGGRVLRIGADGTITALLDSLPSLGDHHTNGPAVRDGYIYFAQGTVTNSGVVGPDNAGFGWLPRHPDVHDIPCGDVVLAGRNYESENALTNEKGHKVQTGAFVPYGTATQPGQVIKGAVPCSGAVMRLPLLGGTPELVAWGLRNPFGLAFSPDGRLFATENAFDVRDGGSRAVWGTGDVLWEIKPGAWYGWPDFAEGRQLEGDPEFAPPGQDGPQRLLQQHPGTPPKPAAILGVHSSANGFDFSRSEAFGYPGQAFIALFGDMAPKVGKVLSPVGFKVVRVNVNTGVIDDFATNRAPKNGPASWIGDDHGGIERPVAARFNRAGTALYIVDFGIVRMSDDGVAPQQQTGVVWRITRI